MDAFFSRLEHELTLILAFTDFDPANGALEKFFKELWGPKFKQVFDLARDNRAETLYQKLVQVKERWRNPLAHGGYEKDWSSVYFHLPGIGPIPGSSRAYGNSVQFNLHPVEPVDHETVCGVFDAVDKFFEESYVKAAHNYVNAGFDIAFDEQSRNYIKRYIVAGATAALIEAEDELRSLNGDMCLEVDHPERVRFVSQPLTKFWR